MQSLRDIFYSHNGRLIHKWDHYFEIYEKSLSAYRGREFNLLEIGISHGGSLQMWRKYFGDKVNIFAMDINEECKKFEEEKTKIFIGSQEDPLFLERLVQQIPKIDVLIDDGGHTMNQQITTFKYLFPHMKANGIYLVEDVHTSYFYAYKGGLKRKGTFIEFSKDIIDKIYCWHIKDENKMSISKIKTGVKSIAFYDSIVILEKGIIEEPFHIMKGIESIKPFVEPALKKETILMQLFKKLRASKQSSYNKYFKGNIG
jgi:hypothetical protein